MHMWHHVTNHLITSNDKDTNSENRITLRVRDILQVDLLQVDLLLVDPFQVDPFQVDLLHVVDIP
jgi:hypothetical protein